VMGSSFLTLGKKSKGLPKKSFSFMSCPCKWGTRCTGAIAWC